MRIQLPGDVKKIIQTLQEAGYEAYAVGGCVRDSLLGRIPSDWDITTSAEPAEVKRLFRRTFDTGIQHGTVTVLFDKTGYEVTTYRIDGRYEDGRHPAEVTFTPNLEEDLKRRDFTVNAMAYNDEAGLIDCFGGMEDLEEGVIRCVGDPAERFHEDALRIMRAVRFAAQLDARIEESTAMAIRELAPTLTRISAERIQVELVKLLTSDHPEKMRDLYELGITAVILPEFDRIMETEQNNPHHCFSVGEHTIHTLMNVENDKVLRLTMLFHDFGKAETRTTDDAGIDHFHGHEKISAQMAGRIMRRLKFDSNTMNRVCRLVEKHDLKVDPSARAVRHAASGMGEDLFPLFLQVKRADTLGQSDYEREEKLDRICRVEQIYRNVQEQKECLNLKQLALDGRDLIALGVQPGHEMGDLLESMLRMVLDDPDKNDRAFLTEYVKKLHE